MSFFVCWMWIQREGKPPATSQIEILTGFGLVFWFRFKLLIFTFWWIWDELKEYTSTTLFIVKSSTDFQFRVRPDYSNKSKWSDNQLWFIEFDRWFGRPIFFFFFLWLSKPSLVWFHCLIMLVFLISVYFFRIWPFGSVIPRPVAFPFLCVMLSRYSPLL